jgi:transposase InsO family protein
VKAVCEGLDVSERRACLVLGQYRSTQRHVALVKSDEDALTTAIVGLAVQYGRYGYKRVAGLLREGGWRVNKKRVERIWRREGLKVPSRQPKRARLWFNDGACVRLREPGSPWENGYIESFNGKLRDEFLNREVFYTLKEASILIEQWRRHYNGVRPHSALRYRPPVPETITFPAVGFTNLCTSLEVPGGVLH